MMTRLHSLLAIGNFLLLSAILLVGEERWQPWVVPGLILFSFPHFMATYFVWLKRIKSFRDELWPLLFPVLYVGVFFLSLQQRLGPLHPFYLIKLTYLYLIYHFCGQLFGVGMWMCGSQKVDMSRWVKLFYRLSFWMMGMFTLVDQEFRGASRTLFYVDMPLVTVPGWLWKLTFFSALASCLGLVLICYMMFLRRRGGLREFMPLLMMAVGLVWFLPPWSEKLVIFLPILHGLQYMPFVYMKLKSEGQVKFWIVSLVSVALGYVLFRVVPFWSEGIRQMGTMWTALVLTTLNNHHYIIDGRIWKLSDPENRDLTSAPELRSREVPVPA